MNLYYRTLGPENGKPLIILHGVFGSCDNWLTVSKAFADTHQIYLLDARNHGLSPHHPEFNYEVMAQDLYEFIEEHKLQAPILIGHSMGGKTVMRFAVNYPQVASKLIIVDISPRYYGPHHQSILAGLNSIILENLSSRQEADTQLSAYIPEMMVRQFLLKNLYKKEDGKFGWRMNLPVITREIEQVGQALPPDSHIDIPTLFIKGALSRYIKAEDEQLIHSIFAQVQIATVEGADHWVQAEKPQEFTELAKKFLLV